MRGIVLATVPQTFLFSLTSPLSSRSNPSRRHIATPSSVDVPWKIPAPQLSVDENFLFPPPFEGGCGGGGGRGGEGWTWNQRVERFSAEAAGWLLSDVVSFAIYSPRASPLVKVNNYADASGGRALLFAFLFFFFFGKNRGNFFLFFSLIITIFLWRW